MTLRLHGGVNIAVSQIQSDDVLYIQICYDEAVIEIKNLLIKVGIERR